MITSRQFEQLTLFEVKVSDTYVQLEPVRLYISNWVLALNWSMRCMTPEHTPSPM